MTAHSFTAALDRIAKEQPGPLGVHVATTGGKKRRSFADIVAKLSAVDRKKRERKGEAFDRLDQFDDIEKAAQPRALKAIDADNSHTPFPHDAGAFTNMRPDQVPRFLGAMTDIDGQEDKTVRLNTLVAMQDRVKHGKVAAMQASDEKRPTKPLVVRMGGKNYIADGHHGLAAAWLNGDSTADVKFKDLSPKDKAVKSARFEMPITKTQPDQNLVFGWASVIEEGGAEVIDTQGHAISEAELESAFYGFAKDARVAGFMHDDIGGHVGRLVECMVFTKAKQEALGIDLGKVGAWVGFQVDPAIFKRVASGEIRAFSIGGSARLEEKP